MRFLVTGATGYIGSACVKRLLHLGYDVTAVTRNLALSKQIETFWANEGLDTSGLSWAKLDLMCDSGWSDAAKNIDIILHVASPVPKGAFASFSELVVPAATGIKTVIRAAAANKVKKIVMTSSIAAMRNGAVNQHKFNHDSWSDLSSKNIGSYAFSKTYAEMLAWNLSCLQNSVPEMVSILPGFVVGPPSYPLLASSSMLLMKHLLYSRFLVPGSLHLVALSDVVELHIAAALSQVVNCRLPCCDMRSTSFSDMREILSDLRVKSFGIKIPSCLLPGSFKYMDADIELDSGLTKQVLSWQPSSTPQALLDMAKFYLKYG